MNRFYTKDGTVARRKSPDSAWPLRRADGKTWAEAKKITPQDTCENECKLGECDHAKAS